MMISASHELPPGLSEWMSRQRWYGSKGREPQLRELGAWDLIDDRVGVAIRTFLLLDETAGSTTIYQVPLTFRQAPLTGYEHALIGTQVSVDSAEEHVYDGPQDPAYARALLQFIYGDQSANGNATLIFATGHRQPGVQPAEVAASRVLSGEQSNTSIIYELTDANGNRQAPVICKVFRALRGGENPDVVTQSALAAAGCALVPQPVGYVAGQWPDPREESGQASGHLAFAQEFLPGVEDAWRVALSAIAADADFTAQARALGEATAEVHETLANVMPTSEATPEVIALILASMRRRQQDAENADPSIAEDHDAIEGLFAAAEASEWPQLQRIHGDYHLGQVVAVPDRGWVLLDFEGEPLRPMSERNLPDSTLRDLAGMLRSFDYVAGSYQQAHPQDPRNEWASAAREAFISGYVQRSGFDLRRYAAPLDAFEIDKALYEAVYEARNRPAWLSIPETAIRRIANRPRGK